jgi:N-acetylmuramoyl-L-alanine amidase
MKYVPSILMVFNLFTIFSFKPLTDKSVVAMDTCNGGKDMGAVFAGVSEKENVLNVASKIKHLNKNENVEIILIRESDEFISLQDRVDKINSLNPNLLISLHANQIEKNDVSGVEAFVYGEGDYTEKSNEYANDLLEALSNKKINSRGVKDASFLVLRKVNCPAVTLELGFITNSSYRKYMTSKKGQKQIAQNIVELFN